MAQGDVKEERLPIFHHPVVDKEDGDYHLDMVDLYHWQEECLKKWDEVKRRGLIEVTTGGGKTLLASVAAGRMIEETKGNIRVYVVVPRVALLSQWRDTLRYAGVEGAVVQTASSVLPSTVGIYTINRARDRVPLLIENDMKEKRHILLILDEFHHYGSEANYHLFDFRSSPFFNEELYSVLGLSATAEVKTLKSRLIPATGPLFYRYELKNAIEDKVVNDFVLFNVAVPLNSEEREEYDEISDKITKTIGKLFKTAPSIMKRTLPLDELILELRRTENEALIALAEALNALILRRRALIATADSRLWTTLDIVDASKRSDRIIIFTERIVQVDALLFLLKDEGYDAVRYTSEMEKSEKRRALEQFRSGEKRILIACRALDEGLNVPDCNVGILLSNTATKLQRIQRSGRVIRKGEGKFPSVLYYVYCQNTVESTSLFSDSGYNTVSSDVYLLDDGTLYSPDYYYRIEMLLSKLKDKTPSARKKIVSLIKYGVIRPEQFETRETLEKRLEKEDNPFQRSYLSLMILLSQAAPYSALKEEEEEERNPFL